MKSKESELKAITKAKDLTSYIMTVTQNSPKQFRFTFVSRLHNVSLDVLEELILANEVFFSKDDPAGLRERLSYQRKAMSSLRLVSYFSMIAMEQKCITMRHYEMISSMVLDCQRLLGAWMSSDKKRLQS